MLLLCFKLVSCLVGNTRDTSVMYKKAISVCLYLMRPQKIKLKSVQINMKRVLYVVILLKNNGRNTEQPVPG